jgi:hypothetical protein
MNAELPLELQLVDEEGPSRGPRPQRLPAGAYDPYNVETSASGKPVVEQAPVERTDLRKLSQWIQLKREVDALKAAGEAPPPPPKR